VSTAGGREKLAIIRGTLDGNKAKFNDNDKATVITVAFNPSEYSIEKSNVFAEAGIPGLGSPIIQFSRGNSRTLSLELLLDTYGTDERGDLREDYVRRFEKLIELDGDLHAPPPCKVLWGDLEFVGVVDSLRKRYVMFLDDGTPVRARITLTLKEYVPVEIQVRETPTSSPDRFKKYLVKEGDSLWAMSAKAYGDASHWRLIADANGIDNPRVLEIGKELVIPPLTGRVGTKAG
jgi:hypothetical protein